MTPVTACTETILVVDDDPEVCALARDVLAEQGYTVVPAQSAEDALQAAERHPSPIDLLLADVVMPGLSGPDLAERLTSRSRRTRVVFMSGYTTEVMGQYGVLRSGAPLIAKPFTVQGLVAKIREVLDYRSPFARPAQARPAPQTALAGAPA